MRKKVIVAGHICLDITPIIQGDKTEKLSDILKPGNLIDVGKADIHIGGSVANTGLGMKKLGTDVVLIGRLGNDIFGEMVKKYLEQYQAEDKMHVVNGESTSYSIVLAVPGIDRIFFHNPGANDTFCPEDVPREVLKDAVLFHFGYPPLMRNMYRENGEELLQLLKRVKSEEVATSLDMAAVSPASKAGLADWKEILKRVIPYIDFFVPSAEELCYMLDRKRYNEWQRRAAGRDITEILDIEQDVKPLADMCMKMGAKVLLIKCGAPGIYYRTAGKETLKLIGSRLNLNVAGWDEREGFEKSYVPDQVVCTTGAGDVSIAGFLTAMLEGAPLETCMHISAAAGAACVSAYDALSGLESLDNLRKRICSGWKKKN